MFVPSVQLTKVYPAFGVAVMVTAEPLANVPAPLVVPPAAGFDDKVTCGMVVNDQKGN